MWNWFKRKNSKTGIRPVAAQTKTLNASWEVIIGKKDKMEANDLWWSVSDEHRLGAYSTHPLIMSCVRRICSAYTDAWLEVGQFKDGKFEAEDSHEVLDLLYNPNPHMDYTAFMEFRLSNLLLTGFSYVWKWRDAMGNIAQLWPLPTPWVKPEIAESVDSETGLIKFYRVTPPGGHEYIIYPQDMVDIRFIDPSSYYSAVSPMHAAANAWQIDSAKSNYMIEMLENLKSPGMVVKLKQEMTPDERAEFRAKLDEVLGQGKRGSPLLLTGEGDVSMPTPLSDLDWPGLSAEQESRICMCFGVPGLLVGARVSLENSPLSSPNLAAAEKVFYSTTVAGLWTKDASALTKGLLANEGYDKLVEFRHNRSQIQALKADELVEAEICERLVGGTIMEINEARERMGLQAIPALKGAMIRAVGKEIFFPGKEVKESIEPDKSESWDEEDTDDSPDDAEEVQGDSDKTQTGSTDKDTGNGTD